MTEIGLLLKDLILGPAHVGFVVTDMREAIAQVKRLYGIDESDIEYQPEEGVQAPTRFAFFELSGLRFEYIQPCSQQFRDLLLKEPSGGGGINHLAWQVSDIVAALEILASRGIVPGYVTPDGIVSIGQKKMVYLAPETTGGQLVELLQYSDQ